MRKAKLTIQQQIEYMDVVKGITFETYLKQNAYNFLSYNNYFFKIKAFAKNYTKFPPDTGKYQNLDFAYLVELSTLDMHLRKFIIKMALDIEHFLKTKLIYDISQNEEDDGYVIVEEFLNEHPDLKDRIEKKSSNSACYDLVQKYKTDYAVWNIVEIISFTDFVDLFESYYAKRDKENIVKGRLKPVKFLRNAAAHNNCLLNKLTIKNAITPNLRVNNKISRIIGISTTTREKKMSNPVVHDFIVMIDVFCDVVSEQTKLYTMKQLKEMFEDRFIVHKDYFSKNEIICSTYNFCKKVIDFYYNSSIIN